MVTVLKKAPSFILVTIVTICKADESTTETKLGPYVL